MMRTITLPRTEDQTFVTWWVYVAGRGTPHSEVIEFELQKSVPWFGECVNSSAERLINLWILNIQTEKQSAWIRIQIYWNLFHNFHMRQNQFWILGKLTARICNHTAEGRCKQSRVGNHRTQSLHQTPVFTWWCAGILRSVLVLLWEAWEARCTDRMGGEWNR